MGPADGPLDLITEPVVVRDRSFDIERPRDPAALLDEHAFEDDEYLPYWAELWPSAPALADALAARADAGPLGAVHELGCGLGVPAIVAALCGADVLATDWSSEAVLLLARNAAAAGTSLRAQRWGWKDDVASLGPARPLVVAADVLYERRNGPLLLAVLPGLVAAGGEAWIADPGRAFADEWLTAAAEAGWDVGTVAHAGQPSVTVHRLRTRG